MKNSIQPQPLPAQQAGSDGEGGSGHPYGFRHTPHPFLTATAAITPSTIEIVRLWSSCARFLPSRDFWTSTATSFLTMPLLPSQMAILETTTAVSTRCVQE